MKRMLSIALVVLICGLVFWGCAGKSKPAVTPSPIETKQTTTPAPTEKEEATASDTETTADVDLTKLSSTMVFGEVFQMMNDPESYMGETIKIRGQYYSQYDETAKKAYHFVIVADATACCQQGIEFVWNGEHAYPEDYPKQDAQVELTGVFSSYQEDGKTYYCLKTDAITVVQA